MAENAFLFFAMLATFRMYAHQPMSCAWRAQYVGHQKMVLRSASSMLLAGVIRTSVIPTEQTMHDIVEAMKWYRKRGNNGHPDAEGPSAFHAKFFTTGGHQWGRPSDATRGAHL